MNEPVKKRVDESWKDQVDRERQTPEAAKPQPGPGPSTPPAAEASAPRTESEGSSQQARFDLFVSGLAMEALIALGELPHPATRKQAVNLPQAKYLIDLLGVLEEKTKGNLVAEEEKLLTDALYQVRVKYLSKSAGGS